MDVRDLLSVVSITVASLSLVWQLVQYYKSIFPIISPNLEWEHLSGLYVMITVTIHNRGRGPLIIKRARLFIDEGTLKEENVIFPELIEWKEGHENCTLSEWCRKTSEIKYPDYALKRFNERIYTKCISLRHLEEHIKFILPEEHFLEQLILKMPRKGVYRVTLVIIPEYIRILKLFKRKVECVCDYIIIPLLAEETSNV